MPFKSDDFQWSRDEKLGYLLQDKYGEEHDEAMEDFADFENGVRKFWAERLRAFGHAYGVRLAGHVTVDIDVIASLLDPYIPMQNRPEAFTRTRTEGDTCGTWELKP